MARIGMDSEHKQNNASDVSLPSRFAAVPLVLDDLAVDDADEDEEDLEEQLIRERIKAARSLFHQPRSDHDTVNSTRSLYDTDIVYLDIAGRRYCEDYYMPNDEAEQDRLQMLHSIFLNVLGGKLTTVPLHNPRKIVDIGTGTGEWAIAMGELYKEAEVTGTDIAKIQPTAVPLNVFFEIDDAEFEGGWSWADDEFDFVHFRSMSGAFEDWNHIYKEAYRHLKPGGWVEVMDLDNFHEFINYFADDPAVMNLFRALTEATERSGRSRGAAHLQPHMLTDAGFTNISVTTRKIPFGAWPEDKPDRTLGGHFLVTQLHGVESVCLRPLTEQLGLTPEAVRKLVADAITSIRALGLDPERSRGLGLSLKVLIGRKPSGGGMELDVPDDRSTMADSTRTVTNGGS